MLVATTEFSCCRVKIAQKKTNRCACVLIQLCLQKKKKQPGFGLWAVDGPLMPAMKLNMVLDLMVILF